MATVTLGNIKFNWKGAYNSSTAYVVDDVVSLSGSSYVCIQAGTNKNPASESAYWEQMSAAGTDGTDVGATLTTQGDILYRDGSGLQRLAKGSAGQALLMNTAANAPEWGSAGGLVATGFKALSGSQTVNSGTFTAVTHGTFDQSLTSGNKIHLRVGINGYLDVNDKTVQRTIYVTPPGGSATDIRSLATGSGGMGASDEIYHWYWNTGAADFGYAPDATWVYEAQSTGTHTFQVYVRTTGGTGNFNHNQVLFHYLITNV